jgi:hypothetical protein
MQFVHRGIQYSLPDEWWAEAGMETFAATGQSFRAGPSPWPELQTFQVSVDEVKPLHRNGTHGVFNDNLEFGTAQSRVAAFCVRSERTHRFRRSRSPE